MADIEQIIRDASAGLDDVVEDSGGDEGVVEEVVEDTSDPSIVDVSGEEKVEEKPVVEKPVEAKVVVKEEVDPLLAELGLTKNAKGQLVDAKGKVVNSIPHPQVAKITKNREKRAIEQVVKALGLDEEKGKSVSFDKISEAIAEKLGGYAELESDAVHFRKAEAILREDSDRYIRILAEALPEKYAKFLKVLDVTEEEKPAKEVVTEFDLSDMPGPDFVIKDKDGAETGKTYSLEGIQKLIKYSIQKGASQAKAEAAKEAKAVLKPVTDRETATKAKAEQDRLDEKAFKEEWEEAKTWDGFEEHFKDILDVMKADTAESKRTGAPRKIKSVYHAYIKVVPKKIREGAVVNEQKLREKILKEIADTPTDTSVASGATKLKSAASSGDPIEDAIRRSIKGLK